MLLKFFASRKNNSPPNPDTNPNPNPSLRGGVVLAEKPLILQIIHAGGTVERYYMALPAARIMEKYPSFVLGRPEIFRRPWDSVVRPEEILVPGQKYYVVPVRTVKKLCLRLMWKPSIEGSSDLVCEEIKDVGLSKTLVVRNPKMGNRCVRFKGVETKTRSDSVIKEDNGKKRSKGKGTRKKSTRFSPSLTMIDENLGSDD